MSKRVVIAVLVVLVVAVAGYFYLSGGEDSSAPKGPPPKMLPATAPVLTMNFQWADASGAAVPAPKVVTLRIAQQGVSKPFIAEIQGAELTSTRVRLPKAGAYKISGPGSLKAGKVVTVPAGKATHSETFKVVIG